MIIDEESAREFVLRHCDPAAMDRLAIFVSLLEEENGRQNLIAAATLTQMWQRHLADSAQLLVLAAEHPTDPWLDLGTGAGFPGVVIAAMRPAWPVMLVESRSRRVAWLERCIDALELPNCRIEGRRLEAMDTFSAGTISARAFAPLAKLVGLARRFSTKRTLWLLPKGRSAEQEVNSLPAGLRALFHVEHSLTDPDAGIVVGRGLEMSKP